MKKIKLTLQEQRPEAKGLNTINNGVQIGTHKPHKTFSPNTFTWLNNINLDAFLSILLKHWAYFLLNTTNINFIRWGVSCGVIKQ